MTTGKVIQFRRGRHTIHERHFVIEVKGVSNREDAEKFVGKTTEWKSPAGKIIKGKISWVIFLNDSLIFVMRLFIVCIYFWNDIINHFPIFLRLYFP